MVGVSVTYSKMFKIIAKETCSYLKLKKKL